MLQLKKCVFVCVREREGGRKGGRTERREKETESEFSLPPPFCSILSLHEFHDAHHLGEGGIFFTRYTESNATLLWK